MLSGTTAHPTRTTLITQYDNTLRARSGNI